MDHHVIIMLCLLLHAPVSVCEQFDCIHICIFLKRDPSGRLYGGAGWRHPWSRILHEHTRWSRDLRGSNGNGDPIRPNWCQSKVRSNIQEGFVSHLDRHYDSVMRNWQKKQALALGRHHVDPRVSGKPGGEEHPPKHAQENGHQCPETFKRLEKRKKRKLEDITQSRPKHPRMNDQKWEGSKQTEKPKRTEGAGTSRSRLNYSVLCNPTRRLARVIPIRLRFCWGRVTYSCGVILPSLLSLSLPSLSLPSLNCGFCADGCKSSFQPQLLLLLKEPTWCI